MDQSKAEDLPSDADLRVACIEFAMKSVAPLSNATSKCVINTARELYVFIKGGDPIVDNGLAPTNSRFIYKEPEPGSVVPILTPLMEHVQNEGQDSYKVGELFPE